MSEQRFESEDDVVEAFGVPNSNENRAKFEKGQVIIQAEAQGYKVSPLCAYIGNCYNMSEKTVYNYYHVSRTFQVFDDSKPWMIYYIASRLVKYRHNDEATIAAQQMAANEIVLKALQEEWSPTQLRQAISGKTPTTKPQKLVDTEAVCVDIVAIGVASVTFHAPLKTFDALEVGKSYHLIIRTIEQEQGTK